MRAFSTTRLTELRWRPAPPDLRPFVTAFIERRDAAPLAGMRELPVPTPLIQIMLGADIHMTDGATGGVAPRAALWGPSSTSSRSRTEAPLHVFVAVLTLRGASILGAAEGGLADRRTPLDDILSAGARAGPARIAEAPDADRRADAAEAWLRGLVREGEDRVDPAISVIDAMVQHRLKAPVADIARRCGVSERALHKRCTRLIGWPPKRLLRIARLQRLLRTLHPSPWLDAGTDEDARLEYADDSHLARDLMDLTGLTVSAYRASKTASGDRLVHTLI